MDSVLIDVVPPEVFPPVVEITAPENLSTFYEGEEVLFEGVVLDSTKHPTALRSPGRSRRVRAASPVTWPRSRPPTRV